MVEQINKPFSHAHVTIITGDQGDGKSNTCVARIVDSALKTIVAVKSPEREEYRAEPLTNTDKDMLKDRGVPYFFNTVKIWLPDGRVHIMSVPKYHIIIPSIRIFTNFHLYGVRYTYCTMPQILKWLHIGLIRDGILAMDEYQMVGNARDSMKLVNKALSKYSFTYRRRNLDVYIMCALERLNDWTMATVATERIYCVYDENTNIITLKIRKRKQPVKTVPFRGAWQYWKYYKTDELMQLPDSEIDRAIASVR